MYALVLLPEDADAKSSIVTGTNRHAWARLLRRTHDSGSDSDTDGVLLEAFHTAVVDAARAFGGTAFEEEHPPPPPVSANGTLRLEFVICNAAPEAGHHFTWDFEALKLRFVDPVTEALAPLATVRVGSSVRLHTAPRGLDNARPAWDASLGAFLWPQKHTLHQLADPQWDLHAPADQPHERVLHFVTFVPPMELCPLALSPKGEKGYTSPDWGGFVVWNPPLQGSNYSSPMMPLEHAATLLTERDMRALMAAFVAQLRVLLGLPGMPLDSALSASSCGFAAWEVDLLARRAASAHGRGAQQSLASLGTIVGGLPNMVVSDTIADLCRRALNALADSRTAGAQGEHSRAGELAAEAHACAERAFFHPSILSLLYFPGDHKLAVYLPLFLPSILPLLLTAMREARHFRRRRACASAWVQTAKRQ